MRDAEAKSVNRANHLLAGKLASIYSIALSNSAWLFVIVARAQFIEERVIFLIDYARARLDQTYFWKNLSQIEKSGLKITLRNLDGGRG